ncbi:hypothetical protein PAHAL_3G108700 [Panicum hallii]|uniref:Peroxidase n=1 Tax=Panicum hallii TaxID=206008 RepID=A0A2T8KHU1_9POAL|nr:peroxidase 2-like [Panicum hallii]PVH61736.1 hypothetical protein PAHAL_3G108700 [Panicum hallii]
MAMATSAGQALLLMALATAALMSTASGTLQYDFYRSSCPKAEEAVRNATMNIIAGNPTMGAAFVRLFFHDCFVRGCDASILLDQSNSNPQPEKLAIPLRGYDAVNTIKAAVEAVCPGVVSCADVLAFAARDSAMVSGGFTFAMPGGRRDGLASDLNDIFGSIPGPSMQVQQLIGSFGAKGLSADDLVALSGAHSFGITHCSFVTPRLYPAADPTLNGTLAASLVKACPRRGPGSTVVNNNNAVTDPNVLSNQYYKNLATGEVLFTSDQTLTSSAPTAKMVQDNAANPVAWMARFAGALVKMGGIEVLTGTQGEIRKVCGATNSGS